MKGSWPLPTLHIYYITYISPKQPTCTQVVHLLTFVLRPANCVIVVINLSIFLDIACFIFTLLIFRVLLDGSVYRSTEQRWRVEEVNLRKNESVNKYMKGYG